MCSTFHQHGTKKKKIIPDRFEAMNFRTPVGCCNHLEQCPDIRTVCFALLGLSLVTEDRGLVWELKMLLLRSI